MKIGLYKKIFLSLIMLFVLVGIFIAVPTYAKFSITESVVLPVIGWISWLIIAIVGKITVLISSLVVSVASYNDFIGSPTVSAGWSIVRDLCNMFFILIMLIIAFATVLRMDKYNAASLLKYVLVYAILINFSKALCGLVIDIAQTVMSTFVGAFSGLGGADFLHVLGIDSILDIDYTGQYSNFWIIIINFAIMIIYAIVAMVVIGTCLLVFAMRIVMLWIYIVLSPLACLCGTLPATRGVTSKWINEFTKYVVTGPALAFFIWLTFSTMNSVTTTSQMGFGTAQGLNAGISVLASTDTMLRFIIAICMLVAGLQVAQGLGDATGAIAAGGLNRLKRGKGWAMKQAGRPFRWAGAKVKQGATAAVKGTARAAGRGALSLAKGIDSAVFKGGVGRGLNTLKENVIKGGAFKKAFHKVTGGKFKPDYNKARREARRNGGKHYDKDGKEYNKAADGTYVDADGNKAKVNGAVLKDFKSEAAARFSEGWAASKSGRKKKAEKEKAKEKQYTEYEESYKDMSGGELRGTLDIEQDPKKQVAIAMQMAEKGEFDAKTDADRDKYVHVKEMVRVVGGEKMLEEFVKRVNKKQVGLNYNLKKKSDGTYEDQAGFNAFKEKVQKGDINLSDQKATSLNKDMLLAFSNSLSATQFNSQLTSAHNKDERVGRQLEDIVKDEEKVNPDSDKVDFLRRIGAKLTGNVEGFYGKRHPKDAKNQQGESIEGELVYEEKAREFFRTANANTFTNMKVGDLEANVHLKEVVIDSMDLGKLKNMNRNGENVPLIKYLVGEMTKPDVSHVLSEKIAETPEFSQYVDNNYDVDIVKKNKMVNEALKLEGSDKVNNHRAINDLRSRLEDTEPRNIRIKQRMEEGNKEIDFQNLEPIEQNKKIDEENTASSQFNSELAEGLHKGRITKEDYELFFRKPLEHISLEEKIDLKKFGSLFDSENKDALSRIQTEIKSLNEKVTAEQSNVQEQSDQILAEQRKAKRTAHSDIHEAQNKKFNDDLTSRNKNS